ncbi:Lrp/AsnC family transcriptional regulator [bacterium]|nr:Lrp/AsnC family transcriptional regulator [bacterium]MBP9807227.1 Lrp/AsnC family transcriptional regulator [bacterium]
MKDGSANEEKRCEVLNILARDGRTTAEAIAKQIGRSVDEVKALITQYESEGVIKRYNAVIDWEKAGFDKVTAFIDVRVVPARDVGFDAIAGRIARFPEVRSVWLVSGGSDLRVVVEATNLRQLANFVAEKLSTINGVTGTVTHFQLRRYKEDDVLYLEAEGSERLVISP